MKMKIVAFFLLLSLILILTLSQITGKSRVPNSGKYKMFPVNGMITPEQSARQARLRKIGMTGDVSQKSRLVAALNNPINEREVINAIDALLRLHAPETLTFAQRILAETELPELRNYVEVAAARYKAERTYRRSLKRPPSEQDSQHLAEDFLFDFLRNLHLDVPQLNEGVLQDKAIVKGLHATHLTVNKETLALRQIAEVIYRYRDRALANVATNWNIRFDVDAGAALKWRLALLSQKERIEWLVNGLAEKKVFMIDDYFTVQLTVDEGKAAGKAIAAKLEEMDKKRGKYSTVGFTGLFRVLSGLGHRDYEPLLARFQEDADDKVAHYARNAYPKVARGMPCQYEYGY
jgi:hypothetical protein